MGHQILIRLCLNHISAVRKISKMLSVQLVLGFLLVLTIGETVTLATDNDDILPAAVPTGAGSNGLGVLTANWQNCRYICQRVLNCYAFTWISSSKICFLKHKTGWSTVSRRGMYSSYQENNFPIMENTDFEGGDL